MMRRSSACGSRARTSSWRSNRRSSRPGRSPRRRAYPAMAVDSAVMSAFCAHAARFIVDGFNAHMSEILADCGMLERQALHATWPILQRHIPAMVASQVGQFERQFGAVPTDAWLQMLMAGINGMFDQVKAVR